MITVLDELTIIFMIMTVITASTIFATILGQSAFELSIVLGTIYFVITFVGYLRSYNQHEYGD